MCVGKLKRHRRGPGQGRREQHVAFHGVPMLELWSKLCDSSYGVYFTFHILSNYLLVQKLLSILCFKGISQSQN